MTERYVGVGAPFKYGADQSDELANKRGQFIDLYHVLTDRNLKFKPFDVKMSDQFTSEWNDETENYGRMDPISNFKRTGRIISLSFAVVAGSAEEAIENFQKVSNLTAMLMPSYSTATGGASTINGAPLFRLKFMNYIHNSNNVGGSAKVGGLLGKLDGISFEPDFEQGQFDVLGLYGAEIYPKKFDISFSFTVFHEHPLGWKGDKARGRGFSRYPYGATDNEFIEAGPKGNIPSNSAGDAAAKSKADQVLRHDRRGGFR